MDFIAARVKKNHMGFLTVSELMETGVALEVPDRVCFL